MRIFPWIQKYGHYFHRDFWTDLRTCLVPTVPNAPGSFRALSVHDFAPPAHHGSLPPAVRVFHPDDIPLMGSFGKSLGEQQLRWVPVVSIRMVFAVGKGFHKSQVVGCLGFLVAINSPEAKKCFMSSWW